MTIIHPTYFPNIEHFNHLLNSKSLCFEINDFYQKQTHRNRTSIYGSNGKLNLVIPVKYEFWQGRPSRLHDRLCYEQVTENGKANWVVKRLAP